MLPRFDHREPMRPIPVSNSTSPTMTAERNERRGLIEATVRELPEHSQTVLHMRFQREMSYRDMAAELGVGSAEAARKSVRTARARLLVRLRAKGLEA